MKCLPAPTDEKPSSKTTPLNGGMEPMERKLIAAAVSSALALPMAAQAIEFSVSGQVNRAIISVDGGGADTAGTKDKYDGDWSTRTPTRLRPASASPAARSWRAG